MSSSFSRNSGSSGSRNSSDRSAAGRPSSGGRPGSARGASSAGRTGDKKFGAEKKFGAPKAGGFKTGGSYGAKKTTGRPMASGKSSAGRPFEKDRRGRELRPIAREDRPAHEPRPRNFINTEAEGVRLQKVLANAGVASRRACEQMIDEGRVEVNGEIIVEQGRRIDPEHDVIHVDGERIQLDADKKYMVFNKPKGVVSTMTDPEGRPAVGDYVKQRHERLFHVGRLDAETEGLLLLTNDGELANRLMHPRYNVAKTYLVQVRGPLAQGVGKQLKDGIKLEDGWASVDSFRLVDSRPGHVLVEVIIHNGKNRIVRRMFDEVGHPVERLLRVAVGPIALGDQKQGTVRQLGRHEVGHLLSLVGL
jgi:pseudouridine synthase